MHLVVDYRLPDGNKSRWMTMALFALSSLVVGGLVLWVGLPLFGPIHVILSFLLALVVALPLHELLHWIVFRAFGETTEVARNKQSVHAPDARLSRWRYVTVLLTPLTIVVVVFCLSFAVAEIRFGAAVALTAILSLYLHDLCRAVVVLRSDADLLWADKPGIAEGWR